MSDSIATLGLRIESSQAATAADNLTRVAAAAGEADAATSGTANAFAKAGIEAEEFVRHAQRHILTLAGANETTRAFTGILAHLPIELLAAGAGIAALTIAFSQGRDEAEAYAKSIAESGNFAGVTASQLAAYADAVGKTAGNTHAAAEALAALTASGAVGKENLASFATVAVQASAALGVSVKDIVKEFADLAAAPLEGTDKLGKSLGYLTPALHEEIRALMAQGDQAAAADEAQKALAASLDEQRKRVEEYGSVWEKLGQKISSVWSGIQNIGRGQTPADQLTSLQQQLQAAQESSGGQATPLTQQLTKDIADAQKRVQVEQAQAQAQHDTNIFAQQYLELQKAIGIEIEANATRSAAQFAAGQSGFTDAVKTAQAEIQRRQDALDAQHAASLVSDTAYYDAKRKLIQADADAEIAGLETQNKLIQEEIAQEARSLALFQKQSGDPAEISARQAQADASAIAKRAQIATNVNQIAIAQINASGKIDQANAAQEQSNKRLEASYLSLVAAGAKYNAELAKQYALQIQGIGAGNVARDRASQLADIEQHFADQARQVAEQHDSHQIDDAEFTRRNQAIDDGLAKARSSFDTYYKDLDAKQSDWLNGAKEAFHNYIDAGKNVADLADKTFTSAFGHIEDAVANFATTGKFSFKDFANSILADLVRMEVKILESKALAAVFGGFFGGAGSLGASSGVGEFSGSTVGFAAGGGNISGPTVVGEAGPELFVPNQSGTIVPNGAWQRGGSTVVNVHNDAGVTPAAVEAAVQRGIQQAKGEIYDDISRGRWNAAIRKAV